MLNPMAKSIGVKGIPCRMHDIYIIAPEAIERYTELYNRLSSTEWRLKYNLQ
jgi:hypothetical protein